MEHVLAKTIIISKVVELIANKYKTSLSEARDRLYDSRIISLIDDDETGLYGESPLYVFSLYEQELKEDKAKPIILETKRLILREMTDDDFDALKKVIHDHDGNEYPDEYVHRWINWCKDSYKKYGFGHWAVVFKETNEMIGSCGVSMQLIDDEWRPEIGYHIRPDYHKQGLGKEVAIAIKDYFFKNFNYDEVYSYMNKDNPASYKTAETNGMTFLHFSTTKDGEECRVYRITRKEWLKS